MSRNYKTATIFGGTGFIGQQIVRELAARGVRIKVATRIPERAYFLRPAGVVGQVVPYACDYNDPDSISDAVKGSDYVVNCIGILYEKGKKCTFQNAHIDLPVKIAAACKKANVESFVHISALGVEEAESKYAQSKLEGEKAVRSNFKRTVILRPSVVFGEDDDFFNRFAEMARLAPALPLIGGGETKFQPVFVGDVADAVVAALTSDKAAGHTFELGGPEVLSFKEIYQRMFKYTGQTRTLAGLSYGFAKFLAFFMEFLPVPPLTRDQVESLKTDNVVSEDAMGLDNLGVNSTALDLILPTYLESYRVGGRFANIKEA